MYILFLLLIRTVRTVHSTLHSVQQKTLGCVYSLCIVRGARRQLTFFVHRQRVRTTQKQRASHVPERRMRMLSKNKNFFFYKLKDNNNI